MHEYTSDDLKRLLHLPAELLDALAIAGYVSSLPAHGRATFGFQDMLMLRAASALTLADISAPKVMSALGNLRAALRPGEALTLLALNAHKTQALPPWTADTLSSRAGQHEDTPAQSRRSPGQLQADAHYIRGHALEDSDIAAARAAYLDALNAHGEHLEARINLGRLLHLGGELYEAEKVYRQAKASSALLSFNLAVLLEDLNKEQEAMQAYRDALAQDPSFHDAHFNLSKLHERAGDAREALRHLLAYRRHATRHEIID